MFSIDQNCHSLWDVLPKLHALGRKGIRTRHFIEDIDVAFTSMGSAVDSDAMRLARERFHRSGGADWGAAMFYFEFLGRQPVDIRRWEPQTGMKTAALARRLGRSVDDLYDEYSPSDNWQLIGPSYVGDRNHHRVVGDLSVAETAPFLMQLLDKARANCLERFARNDSRQRLNDWFDREKLRVEALLAACAGGRLVDLYARWLAEYLGGSVELDRTSALFALGADADRTALMEVFLTDYEAAAGLYNQAIAETSTGLRPLKARSGELPFFATLSHRGHLVRTAVHLDGNDIRIADRAVKLGPDRRLPLEDLAAAGVRCLAGKALLLVIQARLGSGGGELALPHRGSLYMPAARLLGEKLAAAGMMPAELHPVVRVRFGLLDRLAKLDTPLRLPEWLASCFGRCEIPASELGRNYADMSGQATERLDAFRTPEARDRWQRRTFPQTFAEIDRLERRRRELAARDTRSAEIRSLGQRQKQLRTGLLEELLRQIARDTHLAEIDYWDSRGALLPWCIGLDGEGLYNDLIANAEIRPEPEARE